jgi:hypothetical protein
LKDLSTQPFEHFFELGALLTEKFFLFTQTKIFVWVGVGEAIGAEVAVGVGVGVGVTAPSRLRKTKGDETTDVEPSPDECDCCTSIDIVNGASWGVADERHICKVFEPWVPEPRMSVLPTLSPNLFVTAISTIKTEGARL